MPLRRARRYTTADAFLVRPAGDQPAELVRGEVRVMTPAGGAHGAIAGTIFAALHAFVEQRDLGICFPDNTGFLLPGLGDAVRSPDVAFVRGDRLPERGLGPG
jgi:Uma2 family endonuclease